ncbi:hydrolase [Aureococcus anophagefferens]|nr:hydrolase [Aureococcus anophagefferens]
MAQWRTPRQAPGAPNRPTADAHLAALLASPREAPLAVYSSRVVIEAPEDWGHDVVAATVVVEGGRVAAVLPGRRAAARGFVDVDPLVVLPGLVDVVGGASSGPLDAAACAATAVAGGFAAFARRRRDGPRRDGLRLRELRAARAFEEPSSALRGRRPAEARPASPRLSRLRPGPVAVYKDADALTWRAIRRDYSLLTRAHPSEAQARGLRWVLGCGGGADIHVAAVGADQTLRMVRRAKGNAENDVRVTAATTGLHALLSADDVRPGATLYKVRPPIRHTGHGRALWGALDDGALDCVHSGFDPGAPHLKAAGGWRRGSRNPADALRLAGKGRIAPGRDADLLLFDADGAHEAPRGRTGPGIYDACAPRGNVAAVVVRGRVVFARGRRRDAKVGRRLG